MFTSRLLQYSCLLLVPLLFSQPDAPQQPGPKSGKFPYPEKLIYRIEWRLITAGSASVVLTRPGPGNWQTALDIQSAGVMTRMYKVQDAYKVSTDARFCGSNSSLDAQEGKRHVITRLTFDASRRKVKHDEHDLVRNSNQHSEIDVPPCAFEITGALASLRLATLDPGKSTYLPITDGKKLVNARIEAQGKESLTIDGKTYGTVRYEAFLFDNVLYRRKGRLFLWMTDDAEHLPVQFRLQLGFPIGNVTILLEKHERL